MHLFQVGVGSGGMAVLDALACDPRLTHVTIVDPDTFLVHNLERHLFGRDAIGKPKVAAAQQWLHKRRPELTVEPLALDLLDPGHQSTFDQLAATCDFGVCAADNEPAKFHFDQLMRSARKPWTLGEVLSGGIGGFVHRFTPDGPCYGCVASYLKRNVNEAAPGPAPDYSLPGGPVPETRIPASKAAIATIAGLHAVITLGLLDGDDPGFTSLLFTLKKSPGVFAEAYRPYRFQVPRLETCLVCGVGMGQVPEDLDVALDQALARLGDE